MKTILITTSSFGKADKEPLERLRQAGFDIRLNPFGRKLTEAEVLELIEAHQPTGMIAGVEPLSRKVLIAANRLKMISRCGIGMESVDMTAAKERGISVANTPEGPTVAVAELTVGMILTLLRKIHLSDAGIRAGQWVRPMGSLLHGKTVGIIGCGRIGASVAMHLKAFGCQILGCDIIQKDAGFIEIAEPNRLLAESDIISLHIPGGEANYHFIDRQRMGFMKKGAFLINAARGDLVDETALAEALQSGHLAGAALDTFEKEPYDGPLKDMDNVLLTAHIGSYAAEARGMMEMQAVENLMEALNRQGVKK